MTNTKTLGAVREREREREPYFTKINNTLFNNFACTNILKNNKELKDSITMFVSELDTG